MQCMSQLNLPELTTIDMICNPFYILSVLQSISFIGFLVAAHPICQHEVLRHPVRLESMLLFVFQRGHKGLFFNKTQSILWYERLEKGQMKSKKKKKPKRCWKGRQCNRGRVVKASDSKSDSLWERRFESCRLRSLLSRCWDSFWCI